MAQQKADPVRLADDGILISEDGLKALEQGAVALLSIITTPVQIIISGVVGWVLWGWYLTPVFGLAQPGVPITMGVILTIRYLFTATNQSRTEKRDSDELGAAFIRWRNSILWSIGSAAFVLLIGWLLLHWPNLF